MDFIRTEDIQLNKMSKEDLEKIKFHLKELNNIVSEFTRDKKIEDLEKMIYNIDELKKKFSKNINMHKIDTLLKNLKNVSEEEQNDIEKSLNSMSKEDQEISFIREIEI